jgi:hypothetical protein
MMANENGFQINWLWSEKGRNLAGYKSINHPNQGYSFYMRMRCANHDLYTCTACKKVCDVLKKENMQRPTIKSIKIAGNYFLSDPDELHHVCIGNENNVDTTWANLIAKECYK